MSDISKWDRFNHGRRQPVTVEVFLVTILALAVAIGAITYLIAVSIPHRVDDTLNKRAAQSDRQKCVALDGRRDRAANVVREQLEADAKAAGEPFVCKPYMPTPSPSPKATPRPQPSQTPSALPTVFGKPPTVIVNINEPSPTSSKRHQKKKHPSPSPTPTPTPTPTPSPNPAVCTFKHNGANFTLKCRPTAIINLTTVEP